MCASFRWQRKENGESWSQDGSSAWRDYDPNREDRKGLTRGRLVALILLALLILGIVLGVVIRIDDTVRTTGVVEPLKGVPLKAAIKGTVEELFCKEGDMVGEGDVLMNIWPEEREIVTDLEARQFAVETGTTEVEKKTKEIDILEAQRTKLLEERKLLEGDFSGIENAQEKIRLMKVTCEQRKRELARATELGKEQLVSSAELERATAALEIAQAESDAAEAELRCVQSERTMRLESLSRETDIVAKRLALAQVEFQQRKAELTQLQEQLETAKKRMERAVVRAPFAGQVVRLDLRMGDHVEPGAFLLMLAASGSVRVRAELDPKDALYVEPGQEAQVYSRQYSSWTVGFARGGVTEVYVSARNPKAGGAQEVVPAYVQVEESPFPLQLGTRVDVYIVVGKRPILLHKRPLPKSSRLLRPGETQG
ncbi:MAG: HlyD family efflux transporter periplasmic adaptor subunit [Planctomycetota bacterium]